jgi:Mce-associated membrane protein
LSSSRPWPVWLAGWLGYRGYQAREAQAQRNLYVQLARRAAVNLTTISYTEVDADVQRSLDSATGTFRDDFQKRSQPFVDVVKQAQSKSKGTVAEAGLESETGDRAQVLVAVSVRTSIAAAPDQDPRRWRLRISVQKTADAPVTARRQP